ncbi:unnamed protein product [Schistosoma turkestanicum]|nr:unnamed protein product [Schistosoma turkestanicum]
MVQEASVSTAKRPKTWHFNKWYFCIQNVKFLKKLLLTNVTVKQACLYTRICRLTSKPSDQSVQSPQLCQIPVPDNSQPQSSTQHIFRLEGTLKNSPQNYKTLGFKLLNDHFRAETHTVHYPQVSKTEVNKFQEPFYQSALSKEAALTRTPVNPYIQKGHTLLNNLTFTPSSQQILQNTYYPTVSNHPNTGVYHQIGIQKDLPTNSNYIRVINTNNKLDESLVYTHLGNRKTELQHLNPVCETIKNKPQLSFPDYTRSIRWAAEKGLISAAKQKRILWESSREKTSPLQLMQSHSEDHHNQHQSTNNRGEANPSIVNTRQQRLDSEINESGTDQNCEQDKSTHQLNSSNKSSTLNQQPSVTQISAAASFFTRAGQKLAITNNSKRKRKILTNDLSDLNHLSGYCTTTLHRYNQQSKCITGFSDAVHHHPPPMPPTLLKWGRNGTNNSVLNNKTSKVKVILHLRSDHEIDKGSQPKISYLTVEKRKNQVCLNDPNIIGTESTTSPKGTNLHGSKLFAMDGIFTEEDSMAELCAFALTDIIQSVVNGSDGCLISFGTRDSIKSNSMFGDDKQSSGLGIIPSAISWLFRLINEQKERTGARFSVRISAVEVYGKEEALRDLLASVSNATDAAGANAPGIYLREDPISGTQLENQSELRAPTADKAAFYLDSALSARCQPVTTDSSPVKSPTAPSCSTSTSTSSTMIWKRNSHLFFTLHIYQYRVERSGIGSGEAIYYGAQLFLHLRLAINFKKFYYLCGALISDVFQLFNHSERLTEASSGSKVKQFGGQQFNESPVGSSVGMRSGSAGAESGSLGHSGSNANSGDHCSPHAVHSKERKRSTPRTNVYAWPRNAVKNAIETLSTQKEQWVDGPKSDFHPSNLIHQASQVTTNVVPKPSMIDKETQVEEQTKTSVQVISPSQISLQEEHHPTSARCTHMHQKIPGKDTFEQKTDELGKAEQDKQIQNIPKNVSIKPIALERPNITSKSNTTSQMEGMIDQCPNDGELQHADATLSSQCSTCVMADSLMNQSNLTVETGNVTNVVPIDNDTKPQSLESWTVNLSQNTPAPKDSIQHTPNLNQVINVNTSVKQSSNENHLTKSFMNHSDLNASITKVKPFVKDWIQKHSTLPTINTTMQEDFTNTNDHHQLQLMKSDGNELCPVINANLSMALGEIGNEGQAIRHHIFHGKGEFIKPEGNLCSNTSTSKTLTDALFGNAALQPKQPLINSVQTSSNFARIAAWVKSVSVETCNAHESGFNHSSESSAMNKPHDFSNDICTNTKHDLVSHRQTCYCHTNTENKTLFPGEGHFIPHHMTRSRVRNYENAVIQSSNCTKRSTLRRGRSVPPNSIQEGCHSEVPHSFDEYAKQDLVIVSERTTTPLPVSVSSGPLCGKEENFNIFRRSDRDTPSSRRPDGSSNPHLHKEPQGTDIQNIVSSDNKTQNNSDIFNEKLSHHATGFWASSKKSHFRSNTRPSNEETMGFSSMTTKQCANAYVKTSPLRKTCFSPEAKKKSSRLHQDNESHLLVCTSPKSSKCQRSHSFCSSIESEHSCNRNDVLLDSCAIHKLDNAQNDDNVGTKLNILQTTAGKKLPKESRTKTTKGRLSFLTSPLFGKRKDKEAKHSETTIAQDTKHVSHQTVKNSDLRRKPQIKDSDHSNQNKHSSSQIDTSEFQIRIGCIRRDKSNSKNIQSDKQHNTNKNTLSPNLHASTIPLTANTPIASTKISSMQSSSGHGSECSSSLLTEQNIAWNSKVEPNTSLRCRCKRHNHHHHHHTHQHHHHSGNGQKCHRCFQSSHTCRPDYHNNRKCDVANETRKPADGKRSSESGNSASEHRKVENKDSDEHNRQCSDDKALLESFETSKLSIGIPSSNVSGSGPRRGGGHASSGYESIVRDSEASSHADSTSGSSAGGVGVVIVDVKKNKIIPQKHCSTQEYCDQCHRINQTNISLDERITESQQVIQSVSMNSYTKEELNERSIQCSSHRIQSNSQTVQTLITSKIDPNVNNLESSCQGFQQVHLTSPSKQSSQQHSTNSKSSATSKTVTSQSLSSSSSTSQRSRSAPPCSEDTSEETTSSPISVRYVSNKPDENPSSQISTNIKNSARENSSNVSCVLQMYADEVKEMERQIRYEKTYDLLAQQDMLKMELMTAKDRLLIDPSTWSFDLYVAEQMDPDDPSFLEALEKETEILRKRVDACKSHIMLITCFDSQFKSGQLSNVTNNSRTNQPINITYTNTDLN